MPLDLNELRELLTALNQTDIAELTLKSDDFELTVRRGMRSDTRLPQTSVSDVTAGLPTSAISPSYQGAAPLPMPEVPVASPISSPSAPPPSGDRRFVEILSPMVGTFYRSPGPDEPPFVEAGDRIRSGQTVCIIEAMKLMNEIEAEVSGEIVEILVQNASSVEYGQPLMRINPT
ncbi:acetyl-CoA carboxylase biotin carboxyl carrier protein [Phormidesmis sp. 146-35]